MKMEFWTDNYPCSPKKRYFWGRMETSDLIELRLNNTTQSKRHYLGTGSRTFVGAAIVPVLINLLFPKTDIFSPFIYKIKRFKRDTVKKSVTRIGITNYIND